MLALIVLTVTMELANGKTSDRTSPRAGLQDSNTLDINASAAKCDVCPDYGSSQ